MYFIFGFFIFRLTEYLYDGTLLTGATNSIIPMHAYSL